MNNLEKLIKDKCRITHYSDLPSFNNIMKYKAAIICNSTYGKLLCDLARQLKLNILCLITNQHTITYPILDDHVYSTLNFHDIHFNDDNVTLDKDELTYLDIKKGELTLTPMNITNTLLSYRSYGKGYLITYLNHDNVVKSEYTDVIFECYADTLHEHDIIIQNGLPLYVMYHGIIHSLHQNWSQGVFHLQCSRQNNIDNIIKLHPFHMKEDTSHTFINMIYIILQYINNGNIHI